MGLSYTTTHQVQFYECDIHKQLTLPMLMSVAITAGELQTYSLDLTAVTYLEKHHLGWIITNHSLDIHQFPKENEQIFVTTEAESYNKFFCYRNFYIHNQQGKCLATMKSVFSLMDLETRKIVTVPEEVISVYQSEKIKRIHRFPVVPNPSGEMLAQENYRVRYFDLDTNRHVNNARYLAWMLDVLPFSFLEKYEPTHIEISFQKEIEYGNTISSQCEERKSTEADKETAHYIYNQDVLSAKALISWRQRNENE